ncbi:MtrB/PioB family decaheme-associated outer membrane protein [Vibrio vulnificus]|uniref:MtrB/PioB family decaheme-associated outer membrane protein n=1 Tax=Vibrio vulnificus TaxID=672 RepID=UPI0037679D83
MNVSPLWAAIVAALAIPALADDYALQQASEADTSRWSCEPCESDGKWIGEISFGLGYQNNDGASRFNNWVPPIWSSNDPGKGVGSSFNTDLSRYDEDGFYSKLKIEDLGLKRFLMQLDVGQYDGLRFQGRYRESPYYWNGALLSAYSGENNVQTAGELATFEKGVKRETLNLSLALTPHSPWKPHVAVQHERKKGTVTAYTSSIPAYGNVPGYLPKVVDYETLNTAAGVSYIEEKWNADISYQGAFFRQKYSALYYGEQANPYANQLAYEPENDFHQLSLSGNYQLEEQSLNGRLLLSRATSEGGMNPFPQSPVTTDSFHGRVDTVQIDANYHNRLSRSTSLKLGVDYRDRDDRSDRQVVIGQTRKEYDRNAFKFDAKLGHRYSRSLRLNAGYEYRADKRQYAVREETNEHTFYLGTVYRPEADWRMGGKLSYQTRDGSKWTQTSADAPHLRQFYLADRERLELRGDASYDLADNAQFTAIAWLADERYPQPDIGRSEGQDYGYDLGVSFYLEDDTTGHLFFNQQFIRFEQQHANSAAPGWNRYETETKDSVTTVGFGFKRQNLLEKKLSLSLDYSYNHGRGQTNTTGAGYSYPDVDSVTHRLEFIGDYRMAENQSVLLNLRFEDFNEADYLFDAETANMGRVEQDYNGFFAMLSWEFRH